MLANTVVFVDSTEKRDVEISITTEMINAIITPLKLIDNDLICVRNRMDIEMIYGGGRKDIKIGNVRFDLINNRYTWCNRIVRNKESERLQELCYAIDDVLSSLNKMISTVSQNTVKALRM